MVSLLLISVTFCKIRIIILIIVSCKAPAIKGCGSASQLISHDTVIAVLWICCHCLRGNGRSNYGETVISLVDLSPVKRFFELIVFFNKPLNSLTGGFDHSQKFFLRKDTELSIASSNSELISIWIIFICPMITMECESQGLSPCLCSLVLSPPNSLINKHL